MFVFLSFFSPPFCLIYWRSAVSISFTHFRHAFLFYAHFCQYQPRSVTTTTTRTTRMYGGTKRGSRPGSGSPPPTAVLSLEPDFVATFPDEIITRLSFCSHRDSTLCFSVNCSFRPIETATRLIRGLRTNGADRVVRIKCLLRFYLKTVETRQHSTFLVRPLYAFRYDGSFFSLFFSSFCLNPFIFFIARHCLTVSKTQNVSADFSCRCLNCFRFLNVFFGSFVVWFQ